MKWGITHQFFTDIEIFIYSVMTVKKPSMSYNNDLYWPTPALLTYYTILIKPRMATKQSRVSLPLQQSSAAAILNFILQELTYLCWATRPTHGWLRKALFEVDNSEISDDNSALLPAIQQSKQISVPLCILPYVFSALLQDRTTLSMHTPTPSVNRCSTLSSVITYLKIWLVKTIQIQLYLLQQTIISHLHLKMFCFLLSIRNLAAVCPFKQVRATSDFSLKGYPAE